MSSRKEKDLEHMSETLAFKLSCSIILFIAQIAKIVTLMHSRELVQNRISLLPYMISACQALSICFYYIIFAVLDIRDKDPDTWALWRSILSGPSQFFFCALLLLLSCYSHLLGELLIYQDKTSL